MVQDGLWWIGSKPQLVRDKHAMQAELTWGFLLGEGKGERREIRKLRSASWKESGREGKRERGTERGRESKKERVG